ncbi:hypothetical protein PUN28_019799 [Cardiocondyla obscurior]|uniref:Uncharacterized protein n=1 Tax=Cardiocondyla obscurior TaxID=286306 RepID=A0AAW2E8T9_9HYME
MANGMSKNFSKEECSLMMMKMLASSIRNNDLGIEDSGGQLNGPHYDVCACGPDSRRHLISWLPRAQLSLSKELFQLESSPPTLAKYTSLGCTT